MLPNTSSLRKTVEAEARADRRWRFPVGMIVDLARVADGLIILGSGVTVLSLLGSPAGEAATPWLLIAGLVLGMWGLDTARVYQPELTPAWATKVIRSSVVMVSAAAVLAGFSVLTEPGIPLAGLAIFAAWFALSLPAIALAHGMLSLAARSEAMQSRLVENIAVIGPEPEAASVAQELRIAGNGVYEVVALFNHSMSVGDVEAEQPRQGLDDLIAFAARSRIDHVVVASPLPLDSEAHREVLDRLKSLAVDVHLVLAPAQIGGPANRLRLVGDLPLLRVAASPMSGWRGVVKTVEDYAVALLSLPVVLPVLAVAALLIRLESPGPVFFRQARDGFNNVPINVYKFRTMRHESCDASGSRQTRRDDPRVTRVGAFLRRTSLDELPQIINVLRGEMSIVGPRPHPLGMRTEDCLCHEIVAHYAHRHRMKPGITGWAQIHGCRGAVSTARELRRRVELDLAYIERWSVALDLRIIVQTVLTLFWHKNAF